jgi:hypothetical protein
MIPAFYSDHNINKMVRMEVGDRHPQLPKSPVPLGDETLVLTLRTRAKLRCHDGLLAAIAGTTRRCSPDLLEGSFEKIHLQ